MVPEVDEKTVESWERRENCQTTTEVEMDATSSRDTAGAALVRGDMDMQVPVTPRETDLKTITTAYSRPAMPCTEWAETYANSREPKRAEETHVCGAGLLCFARRLHLCL